MKKKQLTAMDHLKRGSTFYDEDKYDEAILEFGKAIAKDKKLSPAYHYRSNAYHAKGDLDLAIADYTTLIKMSPGFYIHHAIRGQLYMDKGDYDRAIADFTAVFETNLFFFEALPGRGRAYFKKNEIERAIEDYTIFLMAYPGHEDIVRQKLQDALACVSPDSPAAVCGYKQLSFSDAISEIDKTIAKDKELPFNYIHNGQVHEARREFDQAIAAYSIVLDDCPEHYLVRYFRGIAYLKMGDYDRAIADFSAVLEISPHFPEVLSRRGRAYHLKNEFERAIEDYTAFIMLCPGSTKIRQKLKEVLSCNSGENNV
jgi:tetratricopeptide (TPR) repeat protein